MLNPLSKKNSIYLKVFPFSIFYLFFAIADAQTDAIVLIKGQTLMKVRAKGLGLNVGVKSIEWKEEALEGVDIEVKKNNVTVLKTTSGKKGKYSFQIPVSTADLKNDYVVYISKDGAGPKMVNINAFLPKEELAKFSAAQYDVDLDLPMVPTTVKDITPDKPFAKIKWDKLREHKFVVDPAYGKVALSEEQKILGNPDQYYSALVKKKMKAEEALAKNKAGDEARLKEEEAKKKADEEAKKLADLKAREEAKRKADEEAKKSTALKAQEEAKRKADEEAKKLTALKAQEEAKRKANEEAKKLAALKAKEEADRMQREKAGAFKKEVERKRMADSLAEVERKKVLEITNAKVDIKKNVRSAEEDESKNPYRVSETYSINIAKKSLRIEKEKRNLKKAENLSAKYETTNILTSLLNAVDEQDKKDKR